MLSVLKRSKQVHNFVILQAKTLLSRVSEIPTLKTIVVTKSIPSEVSGLAETSGIQLMNIKDLMSIGQVRFPGDSCAKIRIYRVAENSIGPRHKFSQRYKSDF